MNPSALHELEKRIAELSPEEQLWLVERLVHRLRKSNPLDNIAWKNDLAAMAADPEIQRELKQIDEEFRCTEGDGVNNSVS